jgi:hypothetical protein
MSSDKVLSIQFGSWPQSRFFLDVVEKIGSNISIEVRNGAHRNVRVELFDANRANAKPLKTGMKKSDNDKVHSALGCYQVVGARGGLITQGGFMKDFGAGKRIVPLPDIGMHQRYRLEIVGPKWNEIGGDSSVPYPYFIERPALFGLKFSRWEALFTTTLLMEVVQPLVAIAWDTRSFIKEDNAYLNSFGESWRSNGTSDKTEGPNFMTLAVMMIIHGSSGNTSQSSISALLYDATKAFVELLVAPNPLITGLPDNVKERIKQLVLRKREVFLRRIGSRKLEKLIAKANVYVKVASLAIDSGEFYAVYNSLNQVDTKHDAYIEFRKDKTAMSVSPEPIITTMGGWMGLPKAQFAWFQLPVTGNIHSQAVFKTWDTSNSSISCVADLENTNPERVTLTSIIANGEPAPFTLIIEPIDSINPFDESLELIEPGLVERTRLNQSFQLTSEQGLPFLFSAIKNGKGTLNVLIINHDHMSFYPNEQQSETVREIKFDVDFHRPSVAFIGDPLEIRVGDIRHLDFIITFDTGAIFNSRDAFSGNITIRNDGTELAISKLTLPVFNAWAGEETDYVFPNTLVFKLENSSEFEGPGMHAKFNWPEPISTGLENEHYNNLGDILEATSWGKAKLKVYIEGPLLSSFVDFAPETRPQIEINISHTQLEVSLLSLHDPGGDNRLVIEGSENVDEPLLGEIYIQITALNRPLYESDRDALLVGHASSQQITITEIYQQNPNGENERIPFRFSLFFDNSGNSNDIVQFTAEYNTQFELGNFEFFGTLQNFIQAVGGGTTELKIHLYSLPDDIRDIYTEYDIPPIQSLIVYVPPPLIVELFDYTDAHELINLNSPGIRRDLIHLNGKLNGEIVNHQHWPNGDNLSENITLLIDNEPHDLTPEIDQHGYFSVDISDIQLGNNHISVIASKPINYVVDGHPNKKEENLVGVAPKIYGFENINLDYDSQTQHYFLKHPREVSFSVKYERSLEGDVSVIIEQDQNPAFTDIEIAELPPSFDARTYSDDTYFEPEEITAQHTIRAKCINELNDGRADYKLVFNTRPEILNENSEDRILRPSSFYLEGDPTQVGFDSTRIDIEIIVRCTTTVNVVNTNANVNDTFNVGDSYDAAITFSVNLAIGNNPIIVTVSNGFGSTSEEFHIHRRDDIYSRRNVGILIQPQNRLMVDVNFYLDDENEQGSNTTNDQVYIPGNTNESSLEEVLNVSFKWNFYSSEDKSCLIQCTGEIIGPNYEIFEVGIPWFESLATSGDIILDPETVPDEAIEGFDQEAWDIVNALFEGAIYRSFRTKNNSGDPRYLVAVPRSAGASS